MARSVLKLIGLVVFETVALRVVNRLGDLSWTHIDWSDLRRWLAVTPTEDALAAVIRLITLACAYWLAGSTVLYVLVRAANLPRAARSVRWITLPPVHRLVDRALAMTLATSSLVGVVGPPARGAPSPSEAVVHMLDTEDLLLPPGVSVPRETPAGPETEATAPPPTVLPPEPNTGGTPPLPRLPYRPVVPASTRAAHVTVLPGDNLWTISGEHLQDMGGRRPGNEEIAAYWLRVIELNRPRLISGDPDLIYPGETIELPPG